MTNPQLKKIPKNMLVEGMFVDEFCGSWMEHPFWRSGFLLSGEKDLQRIQQSSITELWIDCSKGLDISEQQQQCGQRGEADVEVELQALARQLDAEANKPVSIDRELARAAKICGKAREAVAQMFDEARMGRAVETVHCRAMVEEISSSVGRNPGALISLARLKTADDYTYMHSVAVCALMIALARELGLSHAQVQEAGLAGLLHDMGKAMLPTEVLNKPGKLTDAEFELVKSHPQSGYELLREGDSSSEAVMDACLHHHEKVDGSGYPHGLAGDELTLLAKMSAVCDVYDAITSERPYKKGWDPAESLRKMAEWSKGHFDEKVFQVFVKTIGIYPVGSLVRLKSNRLAVVVEQSQGALLKPRINIFYSIANKARMAPQIVDLAAAQCEEQIDGRESPQDWPFKDINELWRQS